MVEAKKAFEAYAQTYKVKVRNYHAENGRFAENDFQLSVTWEIQTISYCGVNDHFQNGKAENRIRYLQEQKSKQLHHSKSRWPSAVELALWPYALRQETHLRNYLPDKEYTSYPLERFYKNSVAPNIMENHSFGCPVFSLQKSLIGERGVSPKW